MSNMKKSAAIIFTCIMVLSSFMLTLAAEEKNDVEICVSLGMIKGDGGKITDEYISSELNKLQVAIMVLRLRGLEDEASDNNSLVTFKDIDKVTWAEGQSILTYLAAHQEIGFTGDEQGNFNPDNLISSQGFYKVMLTVLGYEQNVDFKWKEVITFAQGLGLSAEAKESLTVGEMSKIVVEALKTKNKEGIILAEALVASGDIDRSKAEELGLVETSIAEAEDVVEEKETNSDEIFKQPGIEKYLSTDLVDIEDGIVYVSEDDSRDWAIKHYKPESDYIDDINVPLYNLLKSRIEDSNERENYTKIKYIVYFAYSSKDRKSTDPKSIYIAFTPSYKSSFSLWGFSLAEKNIDTHEEINPYEAPITLHLNMLIDHTTPIDKSKNDGYYPVDEYYIKRLEKDLITLYGDIGSEICKFAVDEYKNKGKRIHEYNNGERSKEDIPFEHTKKFGNITVYSRLIDNIYSLKFHFVETDEDNE